MRKLSVTIMAVAAILIVSSSLQGGRSNISRNRDSEGGEEFFARS